MRAHSVPHIAARVYNSPLAILEPKLQTIVNFLQPRSGVTVDLGVDPLSPDDDPEEPETVDSGSIRVIRISESLIARGAHADGFSGLTSYEWISSAVKEAVSDQNVAGIMLRVDSYGGEVQGVFECADVIRESRAQKPIRCSVDHNAYSAAYLLASQCERIHISRNGGVGSIGVIAMHVDWSRWEAKEGLNVTVVKKGERKDQFSPHKPIDDEALAWLDAECERAYGEFVDAVSWGRDMDAKDVRATEARLYSGQDAVAVGLADQVGSFEQAMEDFRLSLAGGSASGVGGPAAATTKGEPTMSQVVDPATATTAAAPASQDTAAIVSAERDRIAAILGCEEANGREAQARELALTPNMTLETARRILAAAPIQTAAADTGFTAAMQAAANPDVRSDGGASGGDDLQAEVRRALIISGDLKEGK